MAQSKTERAAKLRERIDEYFSRRTDEGRFPTEAGMLLFLELGEEEYPVLSRLAGEIQELLDPPRPALAELGLEGLPASGALCRAMERYRHNARLLLEAWEKQPVSC